MRFLSRVIIRWLKNLDAKLKKNRREKTMKLLEYKRSIPMLICLSLLAAYGFAFFCGIVMAFPPLPTELQMAEPDPSLPKELRELWGKWEGEGTPGKAARSSLYIVIEKIDDKKATLWLNQDTAIKGWSKNEANVAKESGKYKVWYRGRIGLYEFSLKGERLIFDIPSAPNLSVILTRVP